ncbi:MarR family transcriptional regulator [uncultured Rothia sp.]|uniref:MarR family winged helix-turn-helix transcriptional regulator n=1 Tax=uncultured Rothia sp. TaxID=316088 RepID=UPI0032169BEA
MPDIGNWSINRLLSTAARMLEHGWNAQLKELGLTHAGVTALEVISKAGTISQVHVASIVGVQAQTMGKTLARLEAHGHVFRARSTADRRSYLLGITPKGKEVLARAENIDSTLASTAELSNPQFREMLVNIVHELSKQEGANTILREERTSALRSAGLSNDPSEVKADSGDSSTTAVLDVITPEMLEAARSEGRKEK